MCAWRISWSRFSALALRHPVTHRLSLAVFAQRKTWRLRCRSFWHLTEMMPQRLKTERCT